MNKFIENAPEIIEQSAKSPLGLIALMVLVLAVLALAFFKTARMKVRIGIFVLLFLGVAGFAAVVMRQTKVAAARETQTSSPQTTTAAGQVLLPNASYGQAQAGHLTYKILTADLKPYATGNDGKPTQLALSVKVQITETQGLADYVDGRTIRLSVDGAELNPRNSLNVAVYARQMAEAEALFIVPASASQAELLVGRSEDAMAKIPIELKR